MPNRVWLLLFSLALIWGASFLSTAILLDHISPSAVVLQRVAWAAAFLWLVALLKGWQLPPLKHAGDFLILGLMNNIIPFALIAWGQTHIESGLASILNSTTAIFGAILAPIFFIDERLPLNKAIGIIIGVIGVITAIGWGFLSGLSFRELGQFAIIAATFGYAMGGVFAKKRLRHLPPQTNAIGALSAASLIMAAIIFFYVKPAQLFPDQSGWVALFYTSIVATALAYLLYYHTLMLAGAGNVTLVTLLVPIVGISLGVWARNESFSSNELIGFGLLAIGLLIIDGRVLRRYRKSP